MQASTTHLYQRKKQIQTMQQQAVVDSEKEGWRRKKNEDENGLTFQMPLHLLSRVREIGRISGRGPIISRSTLHLEVLEIKPNNGIPNHVVKKSGRRCCATIGHSPSLKTPLQAIVGVDFLLQQCSDVFVHHAQLLDSIVRTLSQILGEDHGEDFVGDGVDGHVCCGMGGCLMAVGMDGGSRLDGSEWRREGCDS